MLLKSRRYKVFFCEKQLYKSDHRNIKQSRKEKNEFCGVLIL